MVKTVVWDIRIPRVILCVLVGVCLGLSGAMIQISTRNPLGDPQLFGLGGGAAVVQALSMAGVIVVSSWILVSLSILASLASALFITFFSFRDYISQSRLALIGVSFSAISVAISVSIFAQARIFSQQTIHFIGGSMSNRVLDNVIPTLPFLVIAILLAVPVSLSLIHI